jgi:hypothetical protein
MGIEYNYVVGYTDILTGETTLCEANYDTFNSELLEKNLINPLIVRDSLVDYRIEWNDDKSSAKLFKNTKLGGYIYNSYVEKLIYSFFFTRVYNEGFCASLVIEDESEIEEVNFLEELKKKIKDRKPTKIIFDEPKPIPKTDFLAELQEEINMRKMREKTRDRKITRKRNRRAKKN